MGTLTGEKRFWTIWHYRLCNRFFNLQLVEKKSYDITSDKISVVSEKFIPYGKEDEQNNIENIRRSILMTDMEKFRLFCKMMRIGKMLSSAKVTHKTIQD